MTQNDLVAGADAGQPYLDASIAYAMRAVADAEQHLVDVTTRAAQEVARRQAALAGLLGAGPERLPNSDSLFVDVDWDTRTVTLLQTTGRELRVVVNEEPTTAPDRAQTSLTFDRPGEGGRNR